MDSHPNQVAFYSILLVSAIALAAGAANVLLTKLLIETPCNSLCFVGGSAGGESRPLSASLYTTLLAFFAMALSIFPVCCPIAPRAQRKPASRFVGTIQQVLYLPLIDDDASSEVELTSRDDSIISRRELAPEASAQRVCGRAAARYRPLLLPTALDVASTALAAAAMLFVSASVGSATRGSLLVFAGVSAALRGEPPSLREWRSISLAALGASVVGVAAVLSAAAGAVGAGSALSTGLGLGLALLGNAAQALQVVVEGALLNIDYSPDELNAVEGLLGSGFLVIVLLIAQASGFEDSRATMCCLASSSSARYLSAALIAAFTLSTAAFMRVGTLGGTHVRAALLVSRAAAVWAAELALGSSTDTAGAASGATWGTYSPMTAGGIAVLLSGALDGFFAARQKAGTSPRNLPQEKDTSSSESAA